MATAKITWSHWAMLVAVLAFVVSASAMLLLKMRSAEERASRSASPSGPIGPAIADFTLPDTAGKPVTFSKYTAGRPAVVSFGTTNCPYCVVQLGEFKKLQQRFGDKVALLEINVGEGMERVAEHAARTRSPVTTLVDLTGSVYSRYGTGGVPVTIVTDAQGRILEMGSVITADRMAQLTGVDKGS